MDEVILQKQGNQSASLDEFEELLKSLDLDDEFGGVLFRMTSNQSENLPDGWSATSVPIQSDNEARAVTAEISIYEHRRDATLKDDASTVAERLREEWDI
jgi:hypothetical protein